MDTCLPAGRRLLPCAELNTDMAVDVNLNTSFIKLFTSF